MLAVVLMAGGCGEAARQVADVPPPEPSLPEGTPFVEPASPPATDSDLPDEESSEGGVPEDDAVGSEDGEETGAGDELDEDQGVEDEDL